MTQNSCKYCKLYIWSLTVGRLNLMSINTEKSLKQNPRQRKATKSPQLKLPKAGRTKSADIQSRLKAKSPWYVSIEHPKQGADCKIPDATGVETGTIQLIFRESTTVGSGGMSGLKIVSPYPNKMLNSQISPASTTGYNYQTLAPSQTDSTFLQWGAGGSIPFTNNAAHSFEALNEVLEANADSVRIVSAEISAVSEGTSLTNKGELIGFVEPFDEVKTPAGALPTVGQLKNHYTSSYIPINSDKGIRARWYPVEAKGRSYKEFVSPKLTNIDTQPQPTTFNMRNAFPRFDLGVVTNGAEVGNVIQYEVVVNYEFIPISNNTNIVQRSPSPTDVMEESMVLNWVQNDPVVKVASEAQIAAAPTTVNPSHDDRDSETSSFGMLFDVVKEIAPVALGLLSLV